MTEGVFDLRTGSQVDQNDQFDSDIAEFDKFLSTK